MHTNPRPLIDVRATTAECIASAGVDYARAAALGISFRPVTATDSELLYQIYAGTRTEELAPVPWTAAQKETFLRAQSHAQEVHYAKHYREATFDIILAGSTPCGRLYLNHGVNEIRIIDIALLPDFRGRGWGTALLRDVQHQASMADTCVTIHVEHLNPARRLYDRLGFQVVTDKGMYQLMKWAPMATLPPLVHLQ